jgi:hypothetical protein
MTQKLETKTQILNYLLNATFAVLFAVIGFSISTFTDKLEKIENTVTDLPKEYVLKLDYRNDQTVLLTTLSEIKEAIQHSAEYMENDYNRRMDKLEKLITDEIKEKN